MNADYNWEDNAANKADNAQVKSKRSLPDENARSNIGGKARRSPRP